MAQSWYCGKIKAGIAGAVKFISIVIISRK